MTIRVFLDDGTRFEFDILDAAWEELSDKDRDGLVKRVAGRRARWEVVT